MDMTSVVEALTALAQPTRLKTFRRLLNAHPDRIAAGAIARACDVPHNTMSAHLAVLARAGLIVAQREGRMMYYGANLDGFRALLGFLMQDCCGGRREICAPLVSKLHSTAPMTKREKVHV